MFTRGQTHILHLQSLRLQTRQELLPPTLQSLLLGADFPAYHESERGSDSKTNKSPRQDGNLTLSDIVVCPLFALVSCHKLIKLTTVLSVQWISGSVEIFSSKRLDSLECLSCRQNPGTGVSFLLTSSHLPVLVDQDEVYLPQAVIEIRRDVLLAPLQINRH